MVRKDLMGGVIFLAFGLAICGGSWQLRLGTARSPQAGFMPFVAGSAMAALALLLLAHALSARKDGQTSSPPSNPAAPPPQEARRRIGVTVAALALSVALLQFLGFPLTVFLFLLLMFRFVEPQPLIRSLVLSLLFATVLVFVFQVLLRVPFPHGILGM